MDGIIVINKPTGMTSHDVINRLRKKYQQKKFGHTGTLDPQASGVLVVLAGRAAKLLQFLEDTDKEYIASLKFGQKTDTGDIWGTVLESKEINSDFDFEQILDSLKGPLCLQVPAYSAKKVNGKKLVDLARNDREIPEIYQNIEIYDAKNLDSLDQEENTHKFKVSCSSGTYVRSICEEIGRRTNNLACMSELIRTKASGFDLKQAEDLDASEHTIYPMTSVLNLPQVHFEPIQDIYNGKHVRIDTDANRVLIMDQDEPIAVYDRHHQNVFSCTRGLWS